MQCVKGRPAGWSSPQSRHVMPRKRQHVALRVTAKAPHELLLGVDIPIAVKSVEVSGRTFHLVVPDIDAVMELYIAAGQLDRDPYWCDVWPSALLMAEELIARPELVMGRRVCEIGCGLGLAGLAAAASGAGEVVLLDREPLALQCALMNAQLNNLPISFGGGGVECGGAVQPAALHQLAQQLALREGCAGAAVAAAPAALASTATAAAPAAAAGRSQQAGGQAVEGTPPAAASSGPGQQLQQLDAGREDGGGSAGPAPGIVRAEVFDWSKPVQRPLCEVAMACDVLYESFSVEPVARVVPQLLLPGDGGRLLLADPPDRARHNRECFLDILCEENRQFVMEECGERRVRVWEESKGDWRLHAIAFMVLRRTHSGDTVGVKAGHRTWGS